MSNRRYMLFSRCLAAFILGSMLMLAGCQQQAVKTSTVPANVAKNFDLTLKAYKSGQFLVDGAVLSAADTSSHFAYLKDINKLPSTVLLLPSDESKIRKQHLQDMARMQLDYGFVVYYFDNGKLVKIDPIDKNPNH